MQTAFGKGAHGLGELLQVLAASVAVSSPAPGACERSPRIFAMYRTSTPFRCRATAYLVDFCWLSSSI
jgi:hypothetical protein